MSLHALMVMILSGRQYSQVTWLLDEIEHATSRPRTSFQIITV